MRIGIIGAGNIAKIHAKTLSTIKEVELQGVYDINKDKGKLLVEKFGGDFYEQLENLLLDIEGVIIASPNYCHKDHILEAVHSNLHILCEKPMSTSVEEAKEIMDVINKSNKRIIMGFNYRYLYYVSKLKDLIDKKELGDIIRITLHFKKDSALRKNSFTWKDDVNSRLTSGAFGDLGVHLVDLIWYLTNNEIDHESIRVKMETNVTEKEKRRVFVDDHTEVYFSLENGAFANIVTSKVTSKERCGFFINILGSEKEVRYHSNEDNNTLIIKNGMEEERIDLSPPLLTDPINEFHGWSDSFRNELRDWLFPSSYPYMDTPTFEDGLRTQITLANVFQKAQASKRSLETITSR
ncbi:Gfo/Idh/MocA family protein [Geomicrobium halophilum]|nr:Gfo/Idh/MocA family oxidoreductase [Geomicrobium halophilum]